MNFTKTLEYKLRNSYISDNFVKLDQDLLIVLIVWLKMKLI